jgi:hypothetical protein
MVPLVLGIIVRDEAARTELRQVLGNDFGLILTIYESKGVFPPIESHSSWLMSF